MNRRGYFHVGFATTLNIILYALTFGRFIWLEAKVRGGVFKNWGRRFRYKLHNFVQPTTEDEIISLVKNSKGIRFFGAGHSFNDGVVADEVLVSLQFHKRLHTAVVS
jgi:FAD/FMN-containing dehydrogenase